VDEKHANFTPRRHAMNGTATRSKQGLTRTLLLGIAGGLSLAAHAGEAQHPNEVTTSVKVSYADLDISHAAGARTLYARIKSAAREACGPDPAILDLRDAASHRACYEQAVARAVNRVGSEQLQALHAAQSGKSRAS
jgi:UrcA family protein